MGKQKPVGQILFCQATKQTKTVDPGNWFFHTGSWAQCGQVGQDEEGKWKMIIDYAPYGKELPAPSTAFSLLEEALDFMSEFFEVPVKKVRPNQFPRPEDL